MKTMSWFDVTDYRTMSLFCPVTSKHAHTHTHTKANQMDIADKLAKGDEWLGL
jgi:hypothetical protein